MSGIFICPKCEDVSYCGCNACKSRVTEGEIRIFFSREIVGDSGYDICPHCNFKILIDDYFNIEWGRFENQVYTKLDKEICFKWMMSQINDNHREENSFYQLYEFDNHWFSKSFYHHFQSRIEDVMRDNGVKFLRNLKLNDIMDE